jgi:hypothetical protein
MAVSSDRRSIFAIKQITPILRQIGENIEHLHILGIIHGAISATSVGRFDHKWKLTNLCGSRLMKDTFEPHRLYLTAPPGKS